MEITQALLADYANIAEGGKLNVLGIFSNIYATNFPANHPQMRLIFMWEAHHVECGKTKQIEIELCDADGKKIFSIGGEFKIPEGKSGKSIYGNQIVELNNVRFEKAGEYVFNIIINGEHKTEAPFEVVTSPVRRG